MHVHFTTDYDFKPTAMTTIAYKAGWYGSVTRTCGEAAIAAGKARLEKTPRREVKDGNT